LDLETAFGGKTGDGFWVVDSMTFKYLVKEVCFHVILCIRDGFVAVEREAKGTSTGDV